MKNYIGCDSPWNYVAPSGGVVGGQGYVHGGLVVVAAETKAVGETYQGHSRGVFQMTKLTADTMATVGARIHWDNTNKRWTTTAGTGTFTAGTVAKAATNADTTVWVRLDGVGVTANA